MEVFDPGSGAFEQFNAAVYSGTAARVALLVSGL